MKWSTRFLIIGLMSLGGIAISTTPSFAQNPFEQFQKKVDEALPKGRLLKKIRDDLSGKSKEDERQEKANQEKERDENKRNANRREPTPAPRPNGYPQPVNRPPVPTPAANANRGNQDPASLLNSNFVPPQIGGRSNPPTSNRNSGNQELPRPFQFSSNNEANSNPNNVAGFGLQLEETEGGLIVSNVTPGGNADQAGLKRGDQIVQLGGVPVQTQAEWNEISQILSAGDQIQVEWSRRGEKIVKDLGFGAERSGDSLAADSNGPNLAPPLSGGSPTLDTREQIGDTAINDFLPPAAESQRNPLSVLRPAPESNRELLAPTPRQSLPSNQQELEYLRQTVDQQNQTIKQLQQEVQRLRAQGANNQRSSRGR